MTTKDDFSGMTAAVFTVAYDESRGDPMPDEDAAETERRSAPHSIFGLSPARGQGRALLPFALLTAREASAQAPGDAADTPPPARDAAPDAREEETAPASALPDSPLPPETDRRPPLPDSPEDAPNAAPEDAIATPPCSDDAPERTIAASPAYDAPEEDAAERREGPTSHRLLGIRFHRAGQVFFYPDNEHTVRKGSKVLVQQEQGPALGEVEAIIEADKLLTDPALCAQGKVLGLALAQDIARDAENRILADEASAFCKTCIRQRNLDMKLVDVEVLHDHSKIIFFFTAPTRIDFRELVKDLVRNYRTRIELRQIGVRHESQMIGGLGNCGMVCCCHRYLRKFAPVTIKMAKEQNLFLNPAKLSGMCGRLLCCLSFEQGNYEEFNRRCPKIGKKYVTAAKGTVKVLRANMFNQTIALQSESGEECEVLLDEWISMAPTRAEPPQTEHAPAGQRFPEGGSRRPRPPKEPERPQRYPHHYQQDGSVEEGDLSALEDNPPPPDRREGARREGRGPDMQRPPKRGRRD